MRKVSEDAAKALCTAKYFKRGNTEVVKTPDFYIMKLHGSRIASFSLAANTLHFSLCGFPTLTTRERLNAIFTTLKYPFRIKQSGNRQYIYFLDSRYVVGNDGDYPASPYMIDENTVYTVTNRNDMTYNITYRNPYSMSKESIIVYAECPYEESAR